ncbi:hypothetical protein J5226_20310 [Lysobacter sp. K5869]|uniref:hypothetical protein n=1 Tax=Lysobacter sp. K5869 TaxID=2820808 RepID=UPI001C05EEC6|nr:hypothetical protein [Lysobacter sp. K5869]QWP75924.1 hypothetical protein J5226_20310 [Lysobacter sp. K5869]
MSARASRGIPLQENNAMKYSLAGCLAAFAVVAAFAPAHAGFKQSVPVDIGTNYAEGNVGYARNSTDAKQSIGCTVYATSGAATPSAMCTAANAFGARVSCTTTEAPLVSAAQSAKGDSYIHFMFDAAKKCTEIWVDNDSSYEPKKP